MVSAAIKAFRYLLLSPSPVSPSPAQEVTDLAASKLETIDFLSSQRSQPRLLPKDHALWGVLESVEPIGGGLLQVRVGDLDRLIPEELAPKLQSLIGRNVSICLVGNQYGAGELPEAEA